MHLNLPLYLPMLFQGQFQVLQVFYSFDYSSVGDCREQLLQDFLFKTQVYSQEGKGTHGLINEACLALTDGGQQGHLSVSSPAGILLTGGNGKHMVTAFRKEEHYSRGAYTQVLMLMTAGVFAPGSILVRKYQLPFSMFYSQGEFNCFCFIWNGKKT